MPLYEYRCPKCEFKSTHMVSIADCEKPQPCNNPKCGHSEAQRIPSPTRTNFRFADARLKR